MKFKNLFTTLLCLTVAAADTNYTGKCKDLNKTLDKKSNNGIKYSLDNCTLDKNGNAVDYEITLECGDDSILSQTGINEISTFTNLKLLTIYTCRTKSSENLNLEPLKKLEKVSELFIKLSNDFNIPKYLKNLKKITYGRCAPDTISYSHIEELDLMDAEYYESKVNLEGNTNLKFLRIESSSDDAGDLDVKLPKHLKSLSLIKYNPTQSLLKQVAANTNLESLNLEFNAFDTKNDDLTPLKKLTKLTELKLSCWMSGEALNVPDFVFSLTGLKTLELSM